MGTQVAGEVRGIDLFAGAGGLTLGFERVGIKTICAVEIDPDRVSTFARHTPHANILATDIKKVDLSNYRGSIDIVYGGPPCQPFSSGGLRNGACDARDMLPWFIKAVRDVQPVAFLMENVPGLAAGNRATYLAHIIAEFETYGYHVTKKILNTADFGVPQKRHRLFIVGLRNSRFRFPKGTHGPSRKFPYIAVQDVLPAYQIGEPNPSKVFYAKRPDPRPCPYDGHLFNGGGRPIDRSKPCHTLLASAGGNKTHFFDDLDLVPKYHRCLMEGGMPREGTLPGARRLTVLESTILQTFPQDMHFYGRRSSQYRQIGDAVPPKLAAALGKVLVKQLVANADEIDADDELEHGPQPLQRELL